MPAVHNRRRRPYGLGLLGHPLVLLTPCRACGAEPSYTGTHSKPPPGSRGKPIDLHLVTSHVWWCPDGPTTDVDLSVWIVRSRPSAAA